jgi:hypothetical protein
MPVCGPRHERHLRPIQHTGTDTVAPVYHLARPTGGDGPGPVHGMSFIRDQWP